jgi:hypothetical protein
VQEPGQGRGGSLQNMRSLQASVEITTQHMAAFTPQIGKLRHRIRIQPDYIS